MRFLFDVRLALADYGRGIGRYTFNLISHLSARPGVEVELLVEPWQTAPSDLRDHTLETLMRLPDGHFDALVLSKLHAYEWKDEPEIVAQVLPHEAVRVSRRLAAIAYDIIPILFADRYLREDSTRRMAEIGSAIARILPRIFAISEATKSDLVERLGVDPERVTTIHGGIDETAWKPFCDRRDRTDDVVYVGGQEFRKNLDGAVEGFAAYCRQRPGDGLRLVLACRIDEHEQARLHALAKALGVPQGRFAMTGFIGDVELVDLVGRARATIFPSLYEGLGLPVLESYAVETPAFVSDNSSLRELAPVECRFDPHSSDAIADTFVSIEDDVALLERSVTFGRELLTRINWSNAAERLLETLAADRPYSRRASSGRIAVFTCLHPQKSGIGAYSSRTFFQGGPFDVFHGLRPAELPEAVRFIRANGGRTERLFPAESFEDMDEISPYAAVLFVLGNSEHNLSSFNAALKPRRASLRRLAYFHDGRIDALWLLHLGNDLSRRDALLGLGTVARSRWVDTAETAAGLRGFAPFLRLSGVREVIVNTEAAAAAIARETGRDDSIRIHRAFHPIAARTAAVRGNDSVLRVAHFGIPSIHKGIPTLIAAMRELGRTRSVELRLVGWHVADYVAHSGIDPADREWITVVDSPSEEAFIEEMASINVAVQLREYFYGEASGSITQLIGLGIKPIVTERMLDPEFRPLVIEVPRGVRPQHLARVIAAQAGSARLDFKAGDHSYTKLADLLAQIALG